MPQQLEIGWLEEFYINKKYQKNSQKKQKNLPKIRMNILP
jgi:hypothetical protein